MFNRKSEYALNKKMKDFIVYPDAYGNAILLSAEDFSSVKEFRQWKNWTKMKNHADEKKTTGIGTILSPLMNLMV